jgi:hypothetical protein
VQDADEPVREGAQGVVVGPLRDGSAIDRSMATDDRSACGIDCGGLLRLTCNADSQ